MMVTHSSTRLFLVMPIPNTPQEAALANKLAWRKSDDEEFDCMLEGELVAWVYPIGSTWQAWALDPKDPTTLVRVGRWDTPARAKEVATRETAKVLRKLKRSFDE